MPASPAADGPRATPPSAEELVRVVALDGPAGSGKTTVAREVARALGWRFVDTGATYRAVTLAVLRAGVDPATWRDDATVADAVVACALRAQLSLSTDPDEAWVRLDGEDVTTVIRGPEVTSAVSAVSAVPAVRAHLVEVQRALMGREGSVVEGRDIATVVAPHAAVKVFLDADPEERARRRDGQQRATGRDGAASREASSEAVKAALMARDARDSQTNKLEASEGALHLDTTDLSLDDVVAAVVSLAEQAGLTASNAS